jgi:hypothetical protein
MPQHRATHSLSVEASIKIRARTRPASASAKRDASVRTRCSIRFASLGDHADLTCVLVDVDANMVHGWPLLLAPMSACSLGGAFYRCHHVEWGVSRFIQSILSRFDTLRRLADDRDQPPQPVNAGQFRRNHVQKH